jgi:aspartate aminotransferase
MIPPDLEELLEPLERFEAIRRQAARLGDRLCDLSYANPYEGVSDAVRAAIRASLDDERLLDLQYSPFGGQTLARRAVGDGLRESHGSDFTFEDVILTPGAMGALHLALRASGRPGEEVIIPVPCWLDYPLYAGLVGLVPVTVPLAPGTFTLDVDAVAAAVSKKTCAILLSHPANPTGRNYGGEALAELATALRQAESRHGCSVTFIADETHRDFVSAGEYRSAAAFYDRCLLVYSFGKYHFIQGQRVGYVAVSPKHPGRREVAAELVRWARITGLVTPTALMQRALPRLLSLEHDQAWLVRWRERLVDELLDSGYSVVRPDATLFVYAEAPAGSRSFDFVKLLAREGVLALPAEVFHHRRFLRLSLTGSERMLERAVPILKRHGPG